MEVNSGEGGAGQGKVEAGPFWNAQPSQLDVSGGALEAVHAC